MTKRFDGPAETRIPVTSAPDAPLARRRHALRRTRGASVSTLVLDVGGVVIPTLFETVTRRGLPSGPFSTSAAPDPEYPLVENGQLAERDYWDRLAERRPDLDIGALWRSCSVVRAEMTGLVERIDGRVRLAAFTNDMAHWFGSDWEVKFPIMRWFDTIVEAAALGVFKPEPEAFRMAADALGEDPRRCLFVDDLAANLGGAAAVGMRTELFDVRDPAGSMDRIAAALALPPLQRPRRVFALSQVQG
ncbi:HAD-IA family hydrolase [Pseudonocardia yunnanensis]|uniref:HAD-IA family hydrolase n=1 Tax=Pseudonocardia yunnanensis TaxID=58107 RepID=A0ABW4FB05_9PSEU